MTSVSQHAATTHHVFVDFENIKMIDLEVVEQSTNLTLLLGPQQSKLDANLVEKMLAHAASVQLVRLKSPAKNAVDFALAYYLGKAAQSNPQASFHIISKDAGYDPLISHLQERNIRVSRCNESSDLLFLKAPNRPASVAPVQAPEALEVPEEIFRKVIVQLKKNKAVLPKKEKGLSHSVKSFAGGKCAKSMIDALLRKLKTEGHVMVDAKKNVTYPGLIIPATN